MISRSEAVVKIVPAFSARVVASVAFLVFAISDATSPATSVRALLLGNFLTNSSASVNFAAALGAALIALNACNSAAGGGTLFVYSCNVEIDHPGADKAKTNTTISVVQSAG